MLGAINLPVLANYLAAAVLGYLCGSVPFGIILTRLAGAPDLRATGSGNIGATNVLRTGRKGLAAATLAGDMLKGTAAVLLVDALLGRDATYLAAFAAFIGHLFPVWLGFKGGKGVATYIGLLLGFKLWLALAAFCVLWAAIAAATRYSSLAALTASIATPMIIAWDGDAKAAQLFLVLSVLLWLMHRANISRLVSGMEGRIGER